MGKITILTLVGAGLLAGCAHKKPAPVKIDCAPCPVAECDAPPPMFVEPELQEAIEKPLRKEIKRLEEAGREVKPANIVQRIVCADLLEDIADLREALKQSRKKQGRMWKLIQKFQPAYEEQILRDSMK